MPPRAAPLATLLALLAPPAGAVVLYDGSLGTTPDRQGWKYVTEPFPASATQTAAGGVTTLDTTPARGDHAGYFSSFPGLGSHPDMPTLERRQGWRVRFDVQVRREEHGARVDRAGFSVIAISDDLWGIELGLWADEVWAQADDPLFTHAEGVAFDTASRLVHYELCALGDRYVLSAEGARILEGPLRAYASRGGCSGLPPGFCPYAFPSFLFLGDDTTSAAAEIDLARVEATGAVALPAIGNTLRLTREAGAIRLEASPSSPALSYRLYRDAAPAEIGRTRVDESPSPLFLDPRSLAEPGPFFFAVTAVDVCGESP